MATGSPRREPGLDLLRAAAIVTVMLYHVASHGFPLPGIGHHGWIGVDLFFVLSGYLIGWQLFRVMASGEAPDWGGFTLGRALRVLPAYMAVLALYVALPSWGEAEGLAPLWQFLSFTVNLFPGDADHRAYSHAWSLCVEEHFYLLFPLAAWGLARRPGLGRVVPVAGALIGAGMLLRSWLWQHEVAPWLGASDATNLTARAVEAYVNNLYRPTWARLDGLLAGVLLAAVRAFRPAWWTRLLARGPWLLVAGPLVLAAALHIDPLGATGAAILFPLVALGFGCLLVAALSPRLPFGRIALPGAEPIALLAFSLYLTHRQVYAWLDDHVEGLAAATPLLAFCVYQAAALAVAVLLYVGVERPALRLRDRLLAKCAARRRAVAASPALTSP
jgi:peptidoglycan/LPS O-acetylase OafA/YrhL